MTKRANDVPALFFFEEFRTAVHYLNALVSVGFPVDRVDDGLATCRLCRAAIRQEDDPHETFCIWDNARKFLDQLNIPTAERTRS